MARVISHLFVIAIAGFAAASIWTNPQALSQHLGMTGLLLFVYGCGALFVEAVFGPRR